MNLQDLVSGYIDRWLRKKNGRKLSVLSKMTGIEYQALREIYSRDAAPHIGLILPLCDIICNYSETLKILDAFFPAAQNKYFKNAKNAQISFSHTQILRQENYQLPFLLASSEGGTTIEEIDVILGEIGLTAVKELLNLEVLSINSDGKINLGTQKHFFIFNSELNKSILESLLSRVDSDRVTLQNEGNLRFSFEGFNDDVIRELDSDIRNLHHKIVNYMNDPTKLGDRKWFCGLFSSPITQQDTSESRINERITPAKQIPTENKFQHLSENTRMLAHDVRRPLTMINSLIELIQNTEDTSRLNQLASQGAVDVKRAIKSVNETIKSALADDDSRALKKNEVSVYEIIFEVLKDIFSYRQCEIQNFTYHFQHNELLFVDKERIKRVLTNIIINAVEASPSSQTIWFHTSTEDDMIQLIIGNSGSQIPDHKLDKIFHSKFTEGKIGGNGVGLYIAKKFVEEHNGLITCQSDESGVEFLIHLPVVKNSQGRDIETVLPETNLEVSRFSEIKFKTTDTDDQELYFLKVLNRYQNQRLKILICDDDSLYINGLVNNFKKYPHLIKNLEIVTYNDPEKILEESADVYVLDYDFGEGSSIDGLKTAKILREQGQKGVICIHSNVLQLVDAAALPDYVDMGFPKPMNKNHCLDILAEGFDRQMDDRQFEFQLEPSKTEKTTATTPKVQIVESCFKGKIAVIDDDPVSCILDVKSLQNHGCTVLEYRAIDLFLDAIEDNSLSINDIDCIITDRNIGRMDVSQVSFPEYMTERLKFFKPIFITSYDFDKVVKEPFLGFKYGIPKEELQDILMSNLKN